MSLWPSPSAISRDLHAESNVESIPVDSESDAASLGNAILDKDAFAPIVEPLGSLAFFDTCEVEGEFLDRAFRDEEPACLFEGHLFTSTSCGSLSSMEALHASAKPVVA